MTAASTIHRLVAYKFTYVALASIFSVNAIFVAATGTTAQVMDFTKTNLSPLALGLRWSFITFSLLFASYALISAIYFYYIMLKTILKSSTKIRKLDRTDDKPLVSQLKRKLFSYIGASSFFAILTLLYAFFNSKLFFAKGC
jgi:hypothetical protein